MAEFQIIHNQLESDIELAFPSGIIIDGIDIALMLKIKLREYSKGKDYNYLKYRKYSNIKKCILIIFSIPFFLFKKFFFLNKKEYDFIFFTTGIEYIGNINPFFDPIKNLLGNKASYIDLDISSKERVVEGKLHSNKNVKFLNFYFRMLDFSFVEKSGKYLSHPSMVLLANIFKKNGLDEIGIIRAICAELSFIRFYACEIKLLLEKYRTKKIFLVCYYGLMQSALVIAAKDLKICTIEMQHSIITEDCNYYNHVKLSSARNINPDYFWCWSNHYLRIIEKFGLYKNLFVGGNLWLNNLRPIKKIKSKDLKVLFCTTIYNDRPIVDWIGRNLIDSIKKLPLVNWVIRLHPSVNSNLEQEIRNFFSKSLNVEVVHAREISFYTQVQDADYHVTYKSTTAIEAEHFGVQNIILGTLDSTPYRQDISEGRYFHADSSEKLCEIINNQLVAKVEASKYFDTIKNSELLKRIQSIQ